MRVPCTSVRNTLQLSLSKDSATHMCFDAWIDLGTHLNRYVVPGCSAVQWSSGRASAESQLAAGRTLRTDSASDFASSCVRLPCTSASTYSSRSNLGTNACVGVTQWYYWLRLGRGTITQVTQEIDAARKDQGKTRV